MLKLLKKILFKDHYEQYRKDIRNTQILQRYQYHFFKYLLNSGMALPRFTDTGFRFYSESDEDGLLLYIFALIGTTNKVCVEVAFGSPYGANTTNLICNWGWTGLLIEENEYLVKKANNFFADHEDTKIYPPKVIHAWVTAENINDLIQKNNCKGEIDLFCLDLDGIDYWVMKALNIIYPRVIVVEYQDIWGPEKSVTVPYQPDFKHPVGHFDYQGASLSAFEKLGKEKGYRLVGCNRYGFNAFFIREGIGEDVLPRISTEKCFIHPRVTENREARLLNAKKYQWVEV